MIPRLVLLVCGLAAEPARGADWELLSIGVRAQVWEQRVLGKDQPEAFNEYDLVATVRMPWAGRSWSSWEMSARLLASAGIIRGADDTAFVASAIPALAFTHRKVPVSVDFGAGLALLSQHQFRDQDYGGPVQFALTFGIGGTVYRQVGIGYRFLHYSDASMYGSHTIGADFHMIELFYAF
ncbi:MAG TPA: acyloxyacyl hydrolase [Burkholderiales bacterium]